MARTKGTAIYSGKSKDGKGGSYWITREAYQALKATSKRTGQSMSTVIEYCVRVLAPLITKQTFEDERKRTAGDGA